MDMLAKKQKKKNLNMGRLLKCGCLHFYVSSVGVTKKKLHNRIKTPFVFLLFHTYINNIRGELTCVNNGRDITAF
jgi:hypothetical protein